MIQPIQITQGNYGMQIPFTLLDGNGNPVNLTASSITLKVQDAQDATGTLISLGGTMTIDSALDGTCHYTVANGDFSYPGTFNAELVVTAGGAPLSFPGLQIIVVPSLPKANN